MPLDPTIQALFDEMPSLANAQMWRMSPEEARVEFARLSALANPAAAPIGKIEHAEAPGPAGTIPLRVYTPVAAPGAALPALVFFHGGGFVLGDLDSYDGLCRGLANESGCRLIAVDYRLAPEHPFPAAVEDCFAAVTWVEEKAPEIGVDPNRIAVAGDSAGGNLAAVVCLLAREKKAPQIDFQLLVYPSTSFRHDSPSVLAFGSGYMLNQATIEWCASHYIPKDTDRGDIRLSPLAVADLKGLPPAYIITAGFDPLHDEGAAYADKLKAAGVAVVHIDYPTMIHGFFSMQGLLPLAGEAVVAAANAVKEALK
jgi:acetyl esterase